MAAGEGRRMRAVLSEDGTTTSHTISLPFKMVNKLGVQKAEDSGALSDTMDDIPGSLTKDIGSTLDDMSGADLLVGAGMKLLSKDANYDPEKNRDTFGVFVYATSDPLVFRALLCFSGGNMGSGKNVTGIYPNYSNMDDMTFVSTDGSVGKKEGSDRGPLPNPMNVYDMVTGTDYLTTLRLFLYVKFCAGVGCDYSVVAFKVGIFGQLNFDFQFRWLNRGYLENQGYSMAGSIQSVVVRFRL